MDKAFFKKLVHYDVETSLMVWAKRDASCYPNLDERRGALRAQQFNLMYAGSVVPIRYTSKTGRVTWLRCISPTYSVSADRLLWLAISGDMPEDGVLHFKDGDPDNTQLENMCWASRLTKQVLQDPMNGVSEYTARGETFFRARIFQSDHMPRMTKSQFPTALAAQQWRIRQMTEANQWWLIEATDAYQP